jgi:hypothetical protein
MACSTASVREATPSFANARVRCVCTVRGLTPSSAAALSRRFQPVHTRDREVDDQHIWAESSDQPHRLRTLGGLTHDPNAAGALEQLGGTFANQCMVLGQDHANDVGQVGGSSSVSVNGTHSWTVVPHPGVDWTLSSAPISAARFETRDLPHDQGVLNMRDPTFSTPSVRSRY